MVLQHILIILRDDAALHGFLPIMQMRGTHALGNLFRRRDAQVDAAVVRAGLDTHAANLRGLTVSQPSLETAFLQLTEAPCAYASEAVADVA